MASVLAPGQAVDHLHARAADDSTLALDTITEVLGASYTLLFRTGLRGADVEEAFCHGVDTGYLDRLKEAAEEKFLPGWLSDLAPGSVFDRAVFGSDQQFARTTFYNHVIRPEGRFHCMIGTPSVTSRHRFHLVVGRPRVCEEFHADHRRLLQAMLPHINGILRLRADLAEAEAVARRMQGALDDWQEPFLVVSSGAIPRFANRAARHWLARGDLIRLDGRGRVALASPADTERLRRALRLTIVEGDQLVTVEIPQAIVAVRLALKQVRWAGLADPAAASDVLLQLRVGGTEHTYDERLASLARRHGLTRREVALVGRLLAGDRLKDAARELGVSYNTCRTYLRQTFEKVDLHRQSDLLHYCVTGLRPGQNAS